ncbi:aryl-sulfate sulfotransferase [Lacinutrix jangbogonensis]|uniref:aryl-sulfate sulfotransferase n=1 Tax=Lacinutrix jangbogonensis TaxID=1469557 RepID=UPI00053F1646|nr:aryl-sulfate sulfotransferase [Lacinutrix jangbogonensis]
MKKSFTLFTVAFIFIAMSCKNDDNIALNNDQTETLELTDNIEIYIADKIDDHLTLAIIKGSNSAFLIDKQGHKKYEWTFESLLGNDLEILPNGQLLGIFKDENAAISFGGYGGVVRLINPDNSIAWEYITSSEDEISHHDVEMLPNGNILILVWEKIDEVEAENNGAFGSSHIYPEKLIEVNPDTNTIVWQWRSWEHIIQDQEIDLPNYGVVADNPQLIHINYAPLQSGDLMHGNGMDYDNDRDIIFLSINVFSEIWVIDHSTTMAESTSHSGGNYNKGGDLLYRFGNPLAYGNTFGDVLFDHNHFPNLLENDVLGKGNMLVYVNGLSTEQSIVYELDIPETFNLTANTDNEPTIVWSFTDENLYNRIISGAVRLKNGNTLICEGDYGFWEVTPEKEIVWKYNGFGSEFWRGYNYELNAPELSNYNLID